MPETGSEGGMEARGSVPLSNLLQYCVISQREGIRGVGKRKNAGAENEKPQVFARRSIFQQWECSL